MSIVCHICNKPISGHYHFDRWGHNVCAEHLASGEITLCSSCQGFTERQHTLLDGRVLCAACRKNVLENDDDIHLVLNDVLHNLHKRGFDDLLMDTVDVEIVSAKQIAAVRGGEINTDNKGLTHSQIKTSFALFGNSRRLYHKIYILESLPKIEFAGTLAHELLHAWQVQNGINPPPLWCEGLCNLGTYYTYIMMPSPLTKIFKKALMENPDPIYGDGFRCVLKLESEIGVTCLIDKYKREYK